MTISVGWPYSFQMWWAMQSVSPLAWSRLTGRKILSERIRHHVAGFLPPLPRAPYAPRQPLAAYPPLNTVWRRGATGSECTEPACAKCRKTAGRRFEPSTNLVHTGPPQEAGPALSPTRHSRPDCGSRAMRKYARRRTPRNTATLPVAEQSGHANAAAAIGVKQQPKLAADPGGRRNSAAGCSLLDEGFSLAAGGELSRGLPHGAGRRLEAEARGGRNRASQMTRLSYSRTGADRAF